MRVFERKIDSDYYDKNVKLTKILVYTHIKEHSQSYFIFRS